MEVGSAAARTRLHDRPRPVLTWKIFSRFHYLTAEMHPTARCFALFVDGQPAAFSGMLYRPHPKADDIYGLSRTVVLPDFQGLGLVFALNDRLGAVYKAKGFRMHTYPAHPGFIRSFDRSPVWRMIRPPGLVNNANRHNRDEIGQFGGRPCAVFAYVGPAATRAEAAMLLTEPLAVFLAGPWEFNELCRMHRGSR